MHRCISRTYPAALATLVILAAFGAFAQKTPAPTTKAEPNETAVPARDFVDSIGVCTHWSYGDQPYGFAYQGVLEKLKASGIRHVRDSLSKRLPDLAQAGIFTCAVSGPPETPDAFQARVKAANRANPGAIDAVEGPNEPDLFWTKERFKASYKGDGWENGPQGIIKGAVAYQKDLYAAMKADKETAPLQVIGPALGITYNPGGGLPNPFPKNSLAEFVDWGNFHPYPGGNPFSFPFAYGTIAKYYWFGTHPSANMDEFPYALNTYAPPFAPKPMACTETGYATDTNGTSEVAHGRYIPRLFCEYFRLNIKRTYCYEFVDGFADPNNREARFGLIRRDLSPKPAYTALKNLIAVLDEPAPAKPTAKPAASMPPKTLAFSLVVSPVGEWTRTQYVHHLLLQNTNGDLFLVFWHEVSSEDASVKPRRQIAVPPLPAVLSVASPVSEKATLFTWNDKGERSETSVKLSKAKNANGANPATLNLSVPDRVSVLRLTPTR